MPESKVIIIPVIEEKKIVSDDVLQTTDFTFEPYNPRKHVGDSGKLLLATSKQDETLQYVIKYEKSDCACNEFMYYKIATAFGLNVPEVKLFQISSDKCIHFKTKNVVGIKYISDAQKFIYNPDDINRTDFYAFKALFVILNEEDSNEFIVDRANKLYKIDNTASFNLSDNLVTNLTVFDILDTKAKEIIEELLNRSAKFTEYDKYAICYNILKREYGQESSDSFLALFERFVNLDESLLDDAINTLCYFYNAKLGDYYRTFIQIRKDECKRFLREIQEVANG